MNDFPESFDLETLLAPAEGEARAGVDLRQNDSPQSLYYRLRDARSEARMIERALDRGKDEREMERGNDNPDVSIARWQERWRDVRKLAIEALSQTKDLEVASWLTEALLRHGDLPGLTAGVKLMTGLVEAFWDELYPLPDDEGITTRVAPIAGLNGSSGSGTLIQPLQRLSLFTRPNGAAFELWQYDQSERIVQAPEATRKQRIEAGAIPFEVLKKEAEEAGAAHFVKLREGALAAGEAWRRLESALDAHAGSDTPPTSAVRDLLDKIAEIAKRFGGGEAATPAAAGAASDAAGSSAAPAMVGRAASSPGAIATREDALRALLDIAEYFLRTEPLSPLAYTLQETVRRARLNWPQLLEEIVQDPATRSAILTSLGIRAPSG